MALCEQAVMGAVYARLKADATLVTTYSADIYAQTAPDAAVYPYVVIGDAQEISDDTCGRQARMLTLSVDTWCQNLRTTEATNISSRIDTLLVNVALTVSGWTHTHTWLESSATIREDETIHVAQRYRIRVEA